MNWHLLGVSFVTIFLAELADRSSLAVFALSGSSKYARAVFIGAATALLAANFLGASVGGKVAEFLPLQLVKIIAVIGFAGLGIRLLWFEKPLSHDREEIGRESATQKPLSPKKLIYNPSNSSSSVFGSTFLTIFLASLGDEEQIATLLLSAQSHAPLVVFGGATLAVISTSLLAVLLGRGVARWLSPQTLKKASGIILLLVSAWLLLDVFHPGVGEIELFDFDGK